MGREFKDLPSIWRRTFGLGVALIAVAGTASGVGHGPVFGLATPTNVQGGWTFDISTMDRVGSLDSGLMTRAMLSYGITGDFQVSVSGPEIFSSAPLTPGRVTAMMPANSDFEGIAAWRFQRWVTAWARGLRPLPMQVSSSPAFNGHPVCSVICARPRARSS